MMDREAIDLINMNGCRIKDDSGNVIAEIFESGRCLTVIRKPPCSLGTYLYVLSYLRELGFEVK